MPGPSGPGYLVIKRIKGHAYRYRQWSWREGGRVRTKCRCLGRADETVPATSAPSAQPRVIATPTPIRRKAHHPALLALQARYNAGEISREDYRNGIRAHRLEAIARAARKDRRFAIERLKAEARDAAQLTIPFPGLRPRHALVTIHEETFITSMMTYAGDHAWRPGFRWIRQPNGTGPTLRDPDIMRLGARMGVAMTTQMWTDPRKPNSPVYNPLTHRISVPDPARYMDVDGTSAERNLYVDTLHEVVHATKRHLHRPQHHLGRTLRERERRYNREELVAELGANLVARRLGVEPEDPIRSQVYLRGYSARLNHNGDDIAWAIREAKKAADYIVQFHPRGGWQAP